MQFVPRRPITIAAKFDGTTESLAAILALIPEDRPSYSITNSEENGTVLTIAYPPGMETTMRPNMWLTLTRGEFGTTKRVMDDRDFRFNFEPLHDQAEKSKAECVALAAPSPAMIDMQALQVRGTALEAALRISGNTSAAQHVVKEAGIFHDYLTGTAAAPATSE